MNHANAQLPASARAALARAAVEALGALLTDAATPAAVRLRAAEMVLAYNANSGPGPDDDNVIAFPAPRQTGARKPAAQRPRFCVRGTLIPMPRVAA